MPLAHMTSTRRKQFGVIDIEALADIDRNKTETLQREPKQVQPEPKPDGPKAQRRWPVLFAVVVGLGVLLFIAWLFRYEVIPVGIPQRGEFQYIVKDRWTNEVEVVWQRADGKLFRSSRQLFEEGQVP